MGQHGGAAYQTLLLQREREAVSVLYCWSVVLGEPLTSWISIVERRMSGFDLALASRAKSSSAAAVKDSASEEREGRVTLSEGAPFSESTASCERIGG